MDLWLELTETGYSAVERLLSLNASEGLRLEFKRKVSPANLGLADDDKRGLGESLSGMSNATGGVILFGIIDRKGADGLDIAHEAQHLTEVRTLSNRIEAYVRDVLSPPNPNVTVMPIERPGSTDGIVAIHVSASEDRPHMSMAPKHTRYYQRALDCNLPMLDYQVRDMLCIRSSPRLLVGYLLRSGVTVGNSLGKIHKSILALTLTNAGRVSAKQPYILVRSESSLRPSGPVANYYSEIATTRSGARSFQGGNQITLHPDQETPVVGFALHVQKIDGECHLSVGNDIWQRWDDFGGVEMSIAIGCEDTPARDVRFQIGASELEQMAEAVLNRKIGRGSEQY